jgi:hypothetical protein
LFIYAGSSAAQSVVGAVVNSSGGVTDILNATDAAVDAREDLAAVAMDNDTMLVTGDGQQPIVIDLRCLSATSDCAPKPWGKATNVPLTSPSLFPLPSGAFLLVGDDATGLTRVFRLSATDAPEKPLKNARHGARAVRFETGQIVFIGGGSPTPEAYAD